MPVAADTVIDTSPHPAAHARKVLGLAAGCLLFLVSQPGLAKDAAANEPAPRPGHAQFLGQAAPDMVHHMADWVVDARDNAGLPFVIIDKQDAKVFVFDKGGKVIGSAWALVGLATGDDSAPGIGTMPLAQITPDLRTTPAGRFVAGMGHDSNKSEVLWVDYADAVALHRVINTNPAERRLERIVSNDPAEHRISYGCINVPIKFFDKVVDPTFKDTRGVVYILPEVKGMKSVFPGYYDVDAKSVDATSVDAKSVDAKPESKPEAASPITPGLTSAAYTPGPGGSVEDHDLAGIVHRPGLQAAEKTLAEQH